MESVATASTNARDFARDSVARYEKIVRQAKAASEMTATAHWQSQYTENMKRHTTLVKTLCTRIGEYAESIAATDVDEENEKNIKDQVKALSEERIRHTAWRERSINPVSSLADQASNELTDLRNRASGREDAQPLIATGLREEIDSIIEGLQRIAWEDDRGILTVM